MAARRRDQAAAAALPPLLRLAHQLTGDPAAARRAVATLLAQRAPAPGSVAGDPLGDPLGDALGDAVVARLVRLARSPAARSTPSPLDALPRRRRAVVVLAAGLDWDAARIAGTVGFATAGSVRRHVRAAARLRPVADWRALLAAPHWSLDPSPELAREVAAARTARRRTLAERGLALGCAATLAVGAGVVASAPAVPARATLQRPGSPLLLRWEARGDLLADSGFVAAAERRWRESRQRPVGHVYVLFAGSVAGGRLAVLEGAHTRGRALVAVVGEHRGALRLDAVAFLDDPAIPVLVVPYAGDRPAPASGSGSGGVTLHALVAPGVRAVDVRAAPGLTHTLGRPPFTRLAVHDGLTVGWTDRSGSGSVPQTAIRVQAAGREPFVGLVSVAGGLQPRPLPVRQVPPPPAWRGLPRRAAPAFVADDDVWWAQVCGSTGTRFALVWASPAPGFPVPIRLEFVTCPSRRVLRVFVVGAGAAAQIGSATGARTGAYGADVQPLGPGHASVVVVGSRRVRRIVAHGAVVGHRFAILPRVQAVGLRAEDAHGHPVRIG